MFVMNHQQNEEPPVSETESQDEVHVGLKLVINPLMWMKVGK